MLNICSPLAGSVSELRQGLCNVLRSPEFDRALRAGVDQAFGELAAILCPNECGEGPGNAADTQPVGKAASGRDEGPMQNGCIGSLQLRKLPLARWARQVQLAGDTLLERAGAVTQVSCVCRHSKAQLRGTARLTKALHRNVQGLSDHDALRAFSASVW